MDDRRTRLSCYDIIEFGREEPVRTIETIEDLETGEVVILTTTRQDPGEVSRPVY